MDAHTYTLRHFTISIVLLVLSVVLFSACLDDSTSTSAETNGCYISSVGFTYLRQPITVIKHKTGSQGQDSTYDSTYYYSYLGSDYCFTIDQVKNRIYNRDSILANTVLTRVPLNVTYTGGALYTKSVNAWETDPWTAFTSGDSLDLSDTINVKVLATDGSTRIYKLFVNMHTTDGDTLRWVAAPACADFGPYKMKAFTLNNAPAVLVEKTSGIKLYMLENGTWAYCDVECKDASDNIIPFDNVDINTLSTAGGSIKPSEIFFRDTLFYMSNHNGVVYESDSIKNNCWKWKLSSIKQEPGLRLIGASDTCLYGVKKENNRGQLMCCNLKQGPLQFRNEKLDADEPADSMVYDSTMWASYWQNNAYNVRRLLLLGKTADGKYRTTWTKSWNTDVYSNQVHVENEVDESWMKYDRSWDDKELLPNLANAQMMYYDDYLIAIGGGSSDGKHSALDSIFVSRDNGMSWRADPTLPMTSEVMGSYVSGTYFTATVADNILWLFVGGKVWRGVQAKLNYDRRELEL